MKIEAKQRLLATAVTAAKHTEELPEIAKGLGLKVTPAKGALHGAGIIVPNKMVATLDSKLKALGWVRAGKNIVQSFGQIYMAAEDRFYTKDDMLMCANGKDKEDLFGVPNVGFFLSAPFDKS